MAFVARLRGAGRSRAAAGPARARRGRRCRAAGRRGPPWPGGACRRRRGPAGHAVTPADHVRVGHDLVPGVDEPGALDVLAAARGGALHLDDGPAAPGELAPCRHAARRAAARRRTGPRRCRRTPGGNATGREALERLLHSLAGLRDRPVDRGEQHGVVHLVDERWNADDTISDPISQAISSTDSALANVPPTASATLAGSQVTWLRTTAPTVEDGELADRRGEEDHRRSPAAPAACHRRRWPWRWAGAMKTPSTAPPTKPTKLRTPMMKPCR